MQKIDCLVAGNGLAGTLLSWFLLEKGFRIALLGVDGVSTSSRVAAGIIHPVTGRRLVKSWMADTFIPFAEKTYADCESRTGKNFYHRKKIVELVKETKEYNDWVAQSSSPELSGYISIPVDVPYKEKLKSIPYAAVVNGGFLNLNDFLDAMKIHLEKMCDVVDETYSFESFEFQDECVRYNGYEADRVIFCEGYKSLANPLWKDLPWQPSKGEILLIRCKGLEASEIINRKIFILPVGDDQYKVGSTYSWDTLNEIPTDDAREKLCSELKKILVLPFEVTGHLAGVRPTVKERRPFLGMHPKNKRAGIFNGLGTKGVMTGPWLAHHFSEHLENKAPLLPEIDVERFSNSLNRND